MRINNFISFVKGTTKIKLINKYNKEVTFENCANMFYYDRVGNPQNYENIFKNEAVYSISVSNDGAIEVEYWSANSSEFEDQVNEIKAKFDELSEIMDEMVQKYC